MPFYYYEILIAYVYKRFSFLFLLLFLFFILMYRCMYLCMCVSVLVLCITIGVCLFQEKKRREKKKERGCLCRLSVFTCIRIVNSQTMHIIQFKLSTHILVDFRFMCPWWFKAYKYCNIYTHICVRLRTNLQLHAMFSM